ncbi:hypothetical protein OHA74_14190 [Streptomyces phaeochromogenes]|uniref:hypothetical protein n=1 Tax=Streptomyces phaeochromogenes TaxID=1923 RepID=UPI002E29FB6F|nr:hypothetical protein [Streptomyces phaeochromogenes]
MTKQASPATPGDRPTPTAPSPRWRHWLWPVAALAAAAIAAVRVGREVLTADGLLLEQETVDGTAVYGLLGIRHPDEHAAGTTMAPRRVTVTEQPAGHHQQAAAVHGGDSRPAAGPDGAHPSVAEEAPTKPEGPR